MHHLMQMIHSLRHSRTLEEHHRSDAESMDLFNILFRWTRNSLAMLGLFLLIVIAFLYIEGRQAASPFGNEFLKKFGEFTEKMLDSEIATAVTVKIPLEKGVTAEQAVKSLKEYTKKMKIDLIDSHTLQRIGKAKKFKKKTTIFELHDPELTTLLLNHNPDFSALLPFRIALHQSGDQAWLMAVDLGLLIHGARDLDEDVKARFLTAQDELLKIMKAGAHGTK